MVVVLAANRAYIAKASRSFSAILHHYPSAEMFG